MTEENQAAGAADQKPRGAQLGIQKIYVKDASYEAPNSPKVFTEDWKPVVETQLQNKMTTLAPDVHEVVLSITVTVKSGERTAYLCEVHQAGIFNISGFPEQHLPAVLSTVCPNILFPFAREAIADLVQRGGFPQLLLPPVNFEGLYAQELARQRQAAEGQGEPASH